LEEVNQQMRSRAGFFASQVNVSNPVILPRNDFVKSSYIVEELRRLTTLASARAESEGIHGFYADFNAHLDIVFPDRSLRRPAGYGLFNPESEERQERNKKNNRGVAKEKELFGKSGRAFRKPLSPGGVERRGRRDGRAEGCD
jgi:hypothetical protein